MNAYFSALALSLALWACAVPALLASQIELIRVPDGGIQPQVAVDSDGRIHLVFYKGDPRAGNLFYAIREKSSGPFSTPIQVNSQEGSAIAAGTIRGAQMALGKGGRVHVLWNGGEGAPEASHPGAPLLYARIREDGNGFEPERNLIQYAAGLDGGSSVAADERGNVYAVWHAHGPGAEHSEAERGIFVAHSSDGGKTFAREKAALPRKTGVCACCGIKAFAGANGELSILYRAATEMVNRNQMLLSSKNQGAPFELRELHPWKVAACPMSSAFLSAGNSGWLAAWETDRQVFFIELNSGDRKRPAPIAPPGKGSRKHPVVVQNSAGETLLVWSEGTGWQRGGAAAWQIFDLKGNPTEHGRAEGIPVWSFATGCLDGNGNFMVMY